MYEHDIPHSMTFWFKAACRNCYCLENGKEMMTLWRSFLCSLRYNREQRIINPLTLGWQIAADNFERGVGGLKGHMATK